MTRKKYDVRDMYRRRRLFEVGSLNFSEGIENLIFEGRLEAMPYVTRHLRGDWGDIADDQWQANNAALRSEGRLDSLYIVTRDLSICVFTEADRSATHVVLPTER